MKKVIEKLNRVLAILLVAAMVVGSVPEMSLVARAEGPSSTDEANQPSDDGEANQPGDDGEAKLGENSKAESEPAAGSATGDGASELTGSDKPTDKSDPTNDPETGDPAPGGSTQGDPTPDGSTSSSTPDGSTSSSTPDTQPTETKPSYGITWRFVERNEMDESDPIVYPVDDTGYNAAGYGLKLKGGVAEGDKTKGEDITFEVVDDGEPGMDLEKVTFSSGSVKGKTPGKSGRTYTISKDDIKGDIAIDVFLVSKEEESKKNENTKDFTAANVTIKAGSTTITTDTVLSATNVVKVSTAAALNTTTGGSEKLNFSLKVHDDYLISKVEATIIGTAEGGGSAPNVKLDNTDASKISPANASTKGATVAYTVDLKADNLTQAIGTYDKITGIEVNVETKRAQYSITQEIVKPNGVTDTLEAPITYDPALTTAGKFAANAEGSQANANLVFTIPAATITAGYKVSKVEYEIGDAGAQGKGTIALGNEGPGANKYTLEAGTIKDDFKLIVTLAAKEYVPKFQLAANSSATVEYTIGETKKTLTPTTAGVSVSGKLANSGSMTFKVTPRAGEKVSYVGTDSACADAAKKVSEASGTYTFTVTDTGNAMSEAPVIYIQTRAPEEVAVVFKPTTLETQKIDIYKVEKTGSTYKGTKVGKVVTTDDIKGATAGDIAIAGKEGGSVMFAAVPQTGSEYEVSGVTVPETATSKATVDAGVSGTLKLYDTNGTTVIANAVTAKVYTVDMAAVDQATTKSVGVNVATRLGEASLNKAVFSLKQGCNVVGNDVTINITDAENTDTTSKTIKIGKATNGTYLTETAGDIVFTVTNGGNTNINITGAAVMSPTPAAMLVKDDSKDPVEYTIKFTAATKGTSVAVAIDASMKGAGAKKTITLNRSGVGVVDASLEVGDKVTKQAGDVYDVEDGEGVITLYATIKDGYKPSIGYTKKSTSASVTMTDATAGVTSETVAGGKKYKFEIATADIKDTTTNNLDINVTATADNKTLTITYDDDEMDISVTSGGDTVDDTAYSSSSCGWNIVNGYDAEVVITPKENYVINEVKTGSTAVPVTNLAGGAKKFIIKNMTADKAYTVTANGLYSFLVNDNASDSDDENVADGGTVSVDLTNANNSVRAYKGATTGTVLQVSSVEITGKAAGDTLTKAQNDASHASNGKVKITIDPKSAGKTLKLTFKFADNKTATLNLKVLPAIKSVNMASTITQDSDTDKEYPLSVSPAGTNLDNLDVALVNVDGTPASISGAGRGVTIDKEDPSKPKLVVKTPVWASAMDAENGNKIIIKIFDKSINASANAQSTKKEVTLTITKQAEVSKGAKVTVLDNKASDVTLALKLESKAADPVVGELWYEVVVSTDSTVDKISGTTNGALTDSKKGTFYIRKEEGASQEAVLLVNKIASGGGVAETFKVKARLVQSNVASMTTENVNTTETNAAETALNVGKVYAETATASLSTIAGKIAFASGQSTEITARTKDPVYATKLKLSQVSKVTTTTVRTGQTAAIAKIDFGGATYTKISSVRVVEGYMMSGNSTRQYGSLGTNSELIEFSQVDDILKMKVKNNLSSTYNQNIVGRYTVEVTADAADNTQPAKATMTVNIVRGIEQITLAPASTKIYKQPGKAATMKITPTYNGGNSGRNQQPQTKKLTYKIVATTASGTPNNETAPDANVARYVSVDANGTVKIDSKYTDLVSETPGTFKVLAKAYDFDDNLTQTQALSEEISIMTVAEEIGEVKLAGVTYTGNDSANAVTSISVMNTATGLTTGQITGLQVVAFKKGTTMRPSYSATQLDNSSDPAALNWNATDDKFTNPSKLTFTSSNPRLVAVDANGRLTYNPESRLTGKVTITVKTTDGGNKTGKIEFNVKYAEPGEIGLMIQQKLPDGDTRTIRPNAVADATDAKSPSRTQNITLTDATANTVLDLYVVQGASVSALALPASLANVSMTISGGRTVEKMHGYGAAKVVASSKTVTVKLTNNRTKKTQTFVITNNAADPKNEALKAPTTTTKQIWTVNGETVGVDGEDEQITYQMNARDKDAYKDGSLSVRVMADEAEINKNATSEANYKKFAEALGLYDTTDNVFQSDVVPINASGQFTLTVDMNKEIPAGTYKLALTFSDTANPGTMYKPVSVSVKVVKKTVKKVTMKKEITLNMSLKDAAKVDLTALNVCTNASLVTFKDLLDINTDGAKAADLTNKFTAFFDLEQADGTAVSGSANIKYIMLKDDVATGRITDMRDRDMNDARSAYVTCTAVNADDDSTVTGIVKINVKFTNNEKSLATWKASGQKVIAGAMQATVTFSPGEVGYALVTNTKKDGRTAAQQFQLNANDLWDSGNGKLKCNRRLNLTATSALEAGTYKVEMLIMPANIYLYSEFAAALQTKFADWKGESDAAAKATKRSAYENVMVQYGAIKITVDIPVTAKTANVKKIAFAPNELKKTPTDWTYSYDNDMNYTVKAVYTSQMGGATISSVAIDSVTNIDNTTATANTKNTLTAEDDGTDEDGILFTLNKTKLQNAEAAYKAGRGNANKTLYGSTVTVKATVNYSGGLKSDAFTFTLTLPTEETTFDQTLTNVRNAKDTIVANVENAMKGKWDSSLNGVAFGGTGGTANVDWSLTDGSGDTKKAYDYVKQAAKELFDELNPYIEGGWSTEIVLDGGTGTAPDWTAILMKYNGSEQEDLKIPTVTDGVPDDNGKLTLRVKFNKTDDNGATNNTLSFTFKIEQTVAGTEGVEPENLKAAIDAFITSETTEYGNGTKYSPTHAKIEADAKADAGIAKLLSIYPTLSLSVEQPVVMTDTETSTVYYSSHPLEWLKKYDAENMVLNTNYTVNSFGNVKVKLDTMKSKPNTTTPYAFMKDASNPYTSTDGIQKAATTGAAGHILGVIVVKSSEYGKKELRVPFKFAPKVLDAVGTDKNTDNSIKKKINTALTNETDDWKLTNKLTETQVMTKAQKAYNNPNITLAWGTLENGEWTGSAPTNTNKGWQKVDASVGGAGYINCKFILQDENEPNSEAWERLHVQIPLTALLSDADALKLIDSNGAKLDSADDVKNIVVPIVDAKLAGYDYGLELSPEQVGDIEDAVKEAIFDAANEALEGQPYVAKWKQRDITPAPAAGQPTKEDDFDFTPYTCLTNGSIAYKIELYATKDGKLNGYDTIDPAKDLEASAAKTLTLNSVELVAKAATQTFAQAKQAVIEALTKNGANVKEWAETAACSDINTALNQKVVGTNTTAKTKLEVKGVAAADLATLAVRPTFTKGSTRTVTLTLKETYTENIAANGIKTGDVKKQETFNVTLAISALTKDEATVKSEITRAVLAITLTNTNVLGTDTLVLATAKQSALVKAASDAIQSSGYSVVMKGTSVTMTKATLNADGGGTITFTIKKDGAADAEHPVTLSIAKLPQTEAELLQAVTKAINDLKATAPYKDGIDKSTLAVAAAKTAVETAYASVYKTDTYTVSWKSGDELAEKKNTSDVVTAYEGILQLYRGTDASKTLITGATNEIKVTLPVKAQAAPAPAGSGDGSGDV